MRDTGQVLCGLEERRGPDLSGAEGRTQLYPEGLNGDNSVLPSTG